MYLLFFYRYTLYFLYILISFSHLNNGHPVSNQQRKVLLISKLSKFKCKLQEISRRTNYIHAIKTTLFHSDYIIDLSRHTISSVQKSMYIISIKFYSNLKGQMILNDNHLDLDPLT